MTAGRDILGHISIGTTENQRHCAPNLNTFLLDVYHSRPLPLLLARRRGQPLPPRYASAIPGCLTEERRPFDPRPSMSSIGTADRRCHRRPSSIARSYCKRPQRMIHKSDGGGRPPRETAVLGRFLTRPMISLPLLSPPFATTYKYHHALRQPFHSKVPTFNHRLLLSSSLLAAQVGNNINFPNSCRLQHPAMTVPTTCCKRAGAECICATQARCSCGAQQAMHCNCEKASTENAVAGARCSCREYPRILPAMDPLTLPKEPVPPERATATAQPRRTRLLQEPSARVG